MNPIITPQNPILWGDNWKSQLFQIRLSWKYWKMKSPLFPESWKYWKSDFLIFVWCLQKRRAPKNDAEWSNFHAEISHMRPIQGQKLKLFITPFLWGDKPSCGVIHPTKDLSPHLMLTLKVCLVELKFRPMVSRRFSLMFALNWVCKLD